MGRGAGKHQGPAGRNDAVVTLEEALEETEPRATVFWGDGLRALARRTSRHVAVRWIHSDEAEEIEGLTTEWSLTPTRGEETRLVCTMPRSREELLWRLQMAAYMLPSGGEVWVAGHRREGIKSAAKPLESLVGAVTTRRTKRHCRVLVAMLDAPALSPPTMEDHEKRFGWDPPTGDPRESPRQEVL